MGRHNVFGYMSDPLANFPAGTSTPQGLCKSADGFLFAYCTGVPTASVSGFAKGCRCIRTDGSAGTMAYINEGTNTSATWTAEVSKASAQTLASLLTLNAGFSVATGQTGIAADADSFRENSVILPQFVNITHKLNPANTSGEFFFIADRAYTLISLKCITNVVPGQACTLLVRKCTAGGTALADATAGATCVEFVTAGIDLTATAGVTQTATLAVTSIAAGDKLACKMGNGSSMVGGHISLKLQCA